MKKIFIGFLIFIKLFFCVGCYKGWANHLRSYEELSTGVVGAEIVYVDPSLYYVKSLKVISETDLEDFLKELSRLEFRDAPNAEKPTSHCVKLIYEDSAYIILGAQGRATKYSSRGGRIEESVEGFADYGELKAVLTKYVDLE